MQTISLTLTLDALPLKLTNNPSITFSVLLMIGSAAFALYQVDKGSLLSRVEAFSQGHDLP